MFPGLNCNVKLRNQLYFLIWFILYQAPYLFIELLTQRLVTITTYVHEIGGLAAHLPNLAAYVPLSRQAANLMYIKVVDNHQFNKNKHLFYLQHGTWTAVEVSEPLVLPAEWEWQQEDH